MPATSSASAAQPVGRGFPESPARRAANPEASSSTATTALRVGESQGPHGGQKRSDGCKEASLPRSALRLLEASLGFHAPGADDHPAPHREEQESGEEREERTHGHEMLLENGTLPFPRILAHGC